MGAGSPGQNKHHKLRKSQTCREKPLHLDPRQGNSIVRTFSTPLRLLNIGQRKRLVLAALRLWELKNGYRR